MEGHEIADFFAKQGSELHPSGGKQKVVVVPTVHIYISIEKNKRLQLDLNHGYRSVCLLHHQKIPSIIQNYKNIS